MQFMLRFLRIMRDYALMLAATNYVRLPTVQCCSRSCCHTYPAAIYLVTYQHLDYVNSPPKLKIHNSLKQHSTDNSRDFSCLNATGKVKGCVKLQVEVQSPMTTSAEHVHCSINVISGHG